MAIMYEMSPFMRNPASPMFLTMGYSNRALQQHKISTGFKPDLEAKMIFASKQTKGADLLFAFWLLQSLFIAFSLLFSWRRSNCLRTAGVPRLIQGQYLTHTFFFIIIFISKIENQIGNWWCEALDEEMSRDMRKPTMWFLTRADTNQAVQLMEMARGLKFCI